MKSTANTLNRAMLISSLAIGVTLFGCSSSNNDDTVEQENDTEQQNEVTGSALGATSATAIGDVFSFGAANRTAYTFANDTDGVSNCSGGCLSNWPSIVADDQGTEGQFSSITRDDSSLQRSFKNRPLYYYQGDASEGEVNGEGLGDVWYVARPDPFDTGETALGTVLVGSGSISDGSGDPAVRNNVDGLTLYTFQNDTTGNSNCNGNCAVTWPPLFADKGSVASDGFTLITRDDGSAQWAVNGQALYFYQGDTVAGDTNGNGLGGVWDVALPPLQ